MATQAPCAGAPDVASASNSKRESPSYQAPAPSAAAALDACEDGGRTSSKSLNGAVWNRYRSEAKYCNHSGAKPAGEPPAIL